MWAQNDGTRNNIWANRYSAGNGWGTATLVELNNAGPAILPDVAFYPSGNALAIWTQFDGTSYDIWSNRHTPTGGWSMPVRIETGTGSSIDPQLAIDGNGNALAVWSQQQGLQNMIFANRLE